MRGNRNTENPRLEQQADHLARMMMRLGKGLHNRLTHNKFCLKPDLTQGQMAILFYLVERGTATMRELSAVGQVTMPTMSEIVGRLVRMHLVRRQPDAKDRRVIRVQVTAKGRKAFAAKQVDARNTFKEMLATLSETDQDEFIRAMQSIERIFVKPVQE